MLDFESTQIPTEQINATIGERQEPTESTPSPVHIGNFRDVFFEDDSSNHRHCKFMQVRCIKGYKIIRVKFNLPIVILQLQELSTLLDIKQLVFRIASQLTIMLAQRICFAKSATKQERCCEVYFSKIINLKKAICYGVTKVLELSFGFAFQNLSRVSFIRKSLNKHDRYHKKTANNVLSIVFNALDNIRLAVL